MRGDGLGRLKVAVMVGARREKVATCRRAGKRCKVNDAASKFEIQRRAAPFQASCYNLLHNGAPQPFNNPPNHYARELGPA